MSLVSRQLGDYLLSVKNVNPVAEFGNSDFTYIDISSVDRESHMISNPQVIAADAAPSRARQLLSENDVIVSTVRPNLNTVAKVSDVHRGAIASTGFCVLRPNPDLLDASYLFHWITSESTVTRLVSLATGATYPAVSDKTIKSQQIDIPSLFEQRRIATILDKAQGLRRKRQEAIRLADELLRAVFIDMYGDPSENPKGWPVVPMGKAIEFKGGSQPSKDNFVDEPRPGYVRLVQIRDFKTDRYKTYIPESMARRSFSIDDVMVARYGPPVFQILRGLSGSYNVALMKAQPTEMVLREFIFWLLQLPTYQLAVISNSERTAGQTGVNLELLNSLDVPIPPIAYQREISRATTKISALILRQREMLSECSSHLSALQNQFFKL